MNWEEEYCETENQAPDELTRLPGAKNKGPDDYPLGAAKNIARQVRRTIHQEGSKNYLKRSWEKEWTH